MGNETRTSEPHPLVDPESWNLAEHFLPKGTQDQKWSLADAIQRAVEDWFDVPEEDGK
jgi:hypothetical protein